MVRRIVLSTEDFTSDVLHGDATAIEADGRQKMEGIKLGSRDTEGNGLEIGCARHTMLQVRLLTLILAKGWRRGFESLRLSRLPFKFSPQILGPRDSPSAVEACWTDAGTIRQISL